MKKLFICFMLAVCVIAPLAADNKRTGYVVVWGISALEAKMIVCASFPLKSNWQDDYMVSSEYNSSGSGRLIEKDFRSYLDAEFPDFLEKWDMRIGIKVYKTEGKARQSINELKANARETGIKYLLVDYRYVP